MKLGFAIPVSGSWATPENQATVARRAEELGYQSLWTFQRLLYAVPTSSEDDSDRPRWKPVYQSVTDPLLSLAFVAAHTNTIRLGTAVLDAPFFSPVLLAKQLSTLDVLSKGRVVAGLGIGWAPEEFAASGVPNAKTGARLEEFIDCLKTIWTQDPVSYEGRFYKVPPSQIRPAPIQQPHPPIMLGASNERALRRAGRLADGWITRSTATLEEVSQGIQIVKESAREAGRDTERLEFVTRGVLQVRTQRESGDGLLTGTLDQVKSALAGYEEAGVTELFFDLNFDPEVGSADADPQRSLEKALEAMEALAPAP